MSPQSKSTSSVSTKYDAGHWIFLTIKSSILLDNTLVFDLLWRGDRDLLKNIFDIVSPWIFHAIPMKIMFNAVQTIRNQDKRICQSSLRQRSSTSSFKPFSFSVAFERRYAGSSKIFQEAIHGSKCRRYSILHSTKEQKRPCLRPCLFL